MTEQLLTLHTKIMRPEYVKFIQDFLSKHPEYHNDLLRLKNDVISIGATESEFTEAISQLGLSLDTQQQPQQIGETPPSNKENFVAKRKDWLVSYLNRPGMLKKLVELDIITHITIAVVVMIPLLIWGLTVLTKPNNQALATEAMPTSTSYKAASSDVLIPRVYASTDKVDATQVFSFPASNITLSVSGTPKKEVYGFFPYWMTSQEDKINIDELTAISLFGLEVDGKGNIVTQSGGQVDGGWAMWNDPKINDLINRARRKRVRVELTMKAFNNTDIEGLVTSDNAQKIFISNVLHLINLKSLQGVNLDFEYTGTPPQAITAGFTRLVTNLNAELKRQIPNSTLTVDTYLNAASIPGLFDVELLSQQADELIIMGYDVHTPKGDPGPVAPLDGPVSILGFMQSYLEKVSPDKLVLAVPYYGYDWPIKADGTPTGEPGSTLPYAEVADLSKGKTISWDDVGQTPYFTYLDPDTKTTRVAYFENTRSLGLKYDLINKKNLKGMGIWALGYDGLNNDLSSLILEKFAN